MYLALPTLRLADHEIATFLAISATLNIDPGPGGSRMTNHDDVYQRYHPLLESWFPKRWAYCTLVALYPSSQIVAHADAPNRISSAWIEQQIAPTMERLAVQPGLLESLTGIASRGWLNEGQMPSDAATAAAEIALERAGIDRARVGILINTSVCRDYLEPSTACIVHGNLGMPSTCMNIDVGNACLGFLNGMDLVASMIENGSIDYGLIVDGEDSRPPISATIGRLLDPNIDQKEFRANFATLTLGSGGAAMLLCRSELHPDAARFVGGVTLAATEHNRLCIGYPDRMFTDTKKLLFAGLELAQQTFELAKRELGWGEAELDEYCLHQVSKVHTDSLCSLLGLPTEKVLAIFPEYGNVGPASIIIALSKSIEAGRIKKGDRVGLLGIGSGLNCSMAELVW
jgi:3-oxoacyl-[acyl-carrier-protein] synthase-3